MSRPARHPDGRRRRDIVYPPIIVSAKTAFRALGQTFTMTGTERVPRTGGVLLAVNHISYLDFIYGGYAAHPNKRLVRFMAKKEIFDHSVGGPLMRSLSHTSVTLSRSRVDSSASSFFFP